MLPVIVILRILIVIDIGVIVVVIPILVLIIMMGVMRWMDGVVVRLALGLFWGGEEQ